MKLSIFTIALFLFLQPCLAQDYVSYFTGDAADVTTSPQGGVCLMGGATENDEAMKWFLERADGGGHTDGISGSGPALRPARLHARCRRLSGPRCPGSRAWWRR